MEGNFIQVYIHFVWSTKRRMQVLDKSFRKELFQHIKQNVKDKKIHVDSINGIEDHVHCMVSLTSMQTMSDVVNALKGESSRWINENKFVDGLFKWQDGYGAYSVSPQNIPKVRNYIFRQEEHHKKTSFKDEMKLFQKFKDA
jgi:putative transposase